MVEKSFDTAATKIDTFLSYFSARKRFARAFAEDESVVSNEQRQARGLATCIQNRCLSVRAGGLVKVFGPRHTTEPLRRSGAHNNDSLDPVPTHDSRISDDQRAVIVEYFPQPEPREELRMIVVECLAQAELCQFRQELADFDPKHDPEKTEILHACMRVLDFPAPFGPNCPRVGHDIAEGVGHRLEAPSPEPDAKKEICFKSVRQLPS